MGKKVIMIEKELREMGFNPDELTQEDVEMLSKYNLTVSQKFKVAFEIITVLSLMLGVPTACFSVCLSMIERNPAISFIGFLAGVLSLIGDIFIIDGGYEESYYTFEDKEDFKNIFNKYRSTNWDWDCFSSNEQEEFIDLIKKYISKIKISGNAKIKVKNKQKEEL